MKHLIVGLGNIGAEYARTRHNAGFMVADELAKRQEVEFEKKRHAFHASFKHRSRVVHLLKPTTYMNLSGKAVSYWMQQEKIARENVLVVVDDIALPFGSLRMRGKGSAAGHNGLKDIERALGTNQYPRLRFGVGDDFSKGRQVDYVLGEFTEEERDWLRHHVEKACEMCLSFVGIGLEKTMSQFND